MSLSLGPWSAEVREDISGMVLMIHRKVEGNRCGLGREIQQLK